MYVTGVDDAVGFNGEYDGDLSSSTEFMGLVNSAKVTW